MARRLAQHCHPPSSSVYVLIFVTLLLWFSFGGKTLASIWGAGAGWRGNSFTTFSLPGTAALFNPDAKDVGVATQLIDWSAVCEVRPCYSTLITIFFSRTSLFTLFVMC